MTRHASDYDGGSKVHVSAWWHFYHSPTLSYKHDKDIPLYQLCFPLMFERDGERCYCSVPHPL